MILPIKVDIFRKSRKYISIYKLGNIYLLSKQKDESPTENRSLNQEEDRKIVEAKVRKYNFLYMSYKNFMGMGRGPQG